jgi:hypothetical protein
MGQLLESNVCNRVFTMGQGAGSRIETRRFQAMGQTALDLYSPHHVVDHVRRDGPAQAVALQVLDLKANFYTSYQFLT